VKAVRGGHQTNSISAKVRAWVAEATVPGAADGQGRRRRFTIALEVMSEFLHLLENAPFRPALSPDQIVATKIPTLNQSPQRSRVSRAVDLAVF